MMKLKCDKCGESLCDWFCCSDCEEKDWESNGKYLLAQEVLKWISNNSYKLDDSLVMAVDADELEEFVKGLIK